MITLVTYDQALMWNRFERIFATFAVMLIVFALESLTKNPTWVITWITLFIAQLIVLKCWLDMSFMREPFKNCWAFKE